MNLVLSYDLFYNEIEINNYRLSFYQKFINFSLAFFRKIWKYQDCENLMKYIEIHKHKKIKNNFFFRGFRLAAKLKFL